MDDERGTVASAQVASATLTPLGRREVSPDASATETVARRDEERQAWCRQEIRKRIDQIDERMRSVGYTSLEGERYRSRRRAWQERMQECEVTDQYGRDPLRPLPTIPETRSEFP